MFNPVADRPRFVRPAGFISFEVSNWLQARRADICIAGERDHGLWRQELRPVGQLCEAFL